LSNSAFLVNLYVNNGTFLGTSPLHNGFFFYFWPKINTKQRFNSMATVLRLARFGKRHNPIYRVVVIDSRKARDDSFIEQIGFYNPNTKAPEIKFEQDRALYWLGVGAQPSDTVKSLLKKAGVMELFHETKAKRSIEGKVAAPKAEKAKKAKLGPKAKARLEAEKAAKEAPAEAPAEA